MQLSNTAIMAEIAAGRIVLDPFDERNLNSVSYDLTLAPTLLLYDPITEEFTKPHRLDLSDYWLQPGEFVLGETAERCGTAKDSQLVCHLGGKSSCARMSLDAVSKGGEGDVGFDRTWTLELRSGYPKPVRLTRGMRICQAKFIRVEGFVSLPYSAENGAHYANQQGPTPAAIASVYTITTTHAEHDRNR